MNLLLDTHVFLWWDSKDASLPANLRQAIDSPRNQVFVSAVTVWEIAIKRGIGKLVFSGSVADSITMHCFTPLTLTVEHAELAGTLPQLHRDPFDRLLVAQALAEGLVLVSVDEQVLSYSVPHL